MLMKGIRPGGGRGRRRGPGAVRRGEGGGAPAPPWATAATAAVGPGPFAVGPGGKPNHNTKPQKTIQSFDRLYKAPKRQCKDP